MKYSTAVFITLAYCVLAQENENPTGDTTKVSSLETDSTMSSMPSTDKPVAFGVELPPILQTFKPFFIPFLPRPFIEVRSEPEPQQAQNPFEVHLTDQLSVEPYLTFPPNAGGGLNFVYHF